MKRLVPMFLTGFFMLAGASTNVFANEDIERVVLSRPNVNLIEWQPDNEEAGFRGWPPFGHHVATRSLQLSESLLRVQMAGSDDVSHFVSYTQIPEILALLDEWDTGFEVNWNKETDTIEIFSDWFRNNQNNVIVDPIDMDNINPDEWVDLEFIFSLGQQDGEGRNFNFSGSGSSDFVTIERFWWTAPDDESVAVVSQSEREELFTSIIGCNTSKIRAIPIIMPDDVTGTFISGFNSRINIQDMIDSEIFTDNDIKRMIELQEKYGTVEAYRLAQNFQFLSEMITSGSFSDENLAQIIATIEHTLSNPIEPTSSSQAVSVVARGVTRLA